MGANARIAMTEKRGREDLSTVHKREQQGSNDAHDNLPYVKIFGAYPVSAKAVSVRDPA